jgi:uncharacterized RDD family membrane protein YckC
LKAIEPSEIIIDRANPFEQDSSKINPWIRFLARWVDYSLLNFFLYFLFFFLFPNTNWKRVELFIPIEFLLWVPVEAFFLSRWGMTPGKWLLKTKIRMENGKYPSYEKALHRSFSVWVRGIAMGIPILNFIAMLFAYSKLKTKGKTSWDTEGKLQILHSLVKRGRIAIAVGILLFSLIFNAYQKRRFDVLSGTKNIKTESFSFLK